MINFKACNLLKNIYIDIMKHIKKDDEKLVIEKSLATTKTSNKPVQVCSISCYHEF